MNHEEAAEYVEEIKGLVASWVEVHLVHTGEDVHVVQVGIDGQRINLTTAAECEDYINDIHETPDGTGEEDEDDD